MTQSQLIEEIEKEHLNPNIPEFKVGDTISIHYRIIEGNKERIQVFTGTVIARKGRGFSETISIYRVAYGSAMERVFPLHTPKISKIVVEKRGKVRRGKLYYLRGVFGKKAKIKERIISQDKRKAAAAAAAPKEPVEKEAPPASLEEKPVPQEKKAEDENKEQE